MRRNATRIKEIKPNNTIDAFLQSKQNQIKLSTDDLQVLPLYTWLNQCSRCVAQAVMPTSRFSTLNAGHAQRSEQPRRSGDSQSTGKRRCQLHWFMNEFDALI